MNLFERIIIALVLCSIAVIGSLCFWLLNNAYFDLVTGDRVEFQSVEKPKLIKDNPLKLEITFNEKDQVKEAGHLPENTELEKIETLSQVLDIPFTAQAPFAEWDNPIYQDGCEEAAALMTMSWVNGDVLNKIKSQRKIIDLANWQIEHYGEFRDTSVDDTVDRIFKEYFGYNKVEVKKSININNIINELQKGNAVIVPANGQALNNPHYTQPGPERHNLVLRGYDENTQEFITNDPGTKHGELYRYDQQVLYNAIRDYPTGFQLPIEQIQKNMIVVSK